MWTWKQSTGYLFRDGETVAWGYSGHGDGVNNPDMQQVQKVGPIPVGTYMLGEAGTMPHLGPEAIPLHPDEGNEMFGRSGFYIHGDNAAQNHTASEGCLILPRAIRDRIAESGDDRLTVIA